MGKIRIFAAGAAVAIALLAGGLPAGAEGPEGEAFRIGIYDNWPKLWLDERGQAQGIFPDIIRETAARRGWEVEYVPGTWDESLSRLRSGEIDLMPDVAFSPERAEEFGFSRETVLVNWGNIYSRSGIRPQSIADLAGRRIATLENGIHYDGPLGLRNLLLSFAIEAETVFVREYDDIFRLLDEGQADYGIVNRIYGFANEGRYRVERTSIILNPTELRFAFPKGSERGERLAAALDEELADMKETPGSPYHQAMLRHLGRLTAQVEVAPPWARPLAYGFGAAVALAALTAGGGYLIKRRLEEMLEERAAQLKESEERYRAVFRAAGDAVLIAIDGRISDANGKAAESFGLAGPVEMSGLTLDSLLPTVPDPGQTVEAELKRRDGRTFPAEIFATDLRCGGRKVTYAVVRDITDRREAEEEGRRLNRMKSQFLRAASHQLRTPLTSVRWGLEGISGRGDSLTAEQRDSLRSAAEANLELITRVDDLDYALDIESGNIRLKPEPSSLETVFEAAAVRLDAVRNARGILLVREWPAGQRTGIVADRQKVGDALFRLLDNAISYTPVGGTVTVRIVPLPDGVRVEVSDDGIGIPAADQERIFERLTRGSNAALMKADGSGLGLYIAKSVIEAHGGRIGVRSEIGRGSTFWLELPAGSAYPRRDPESDR